MGYVADVQDDSIAESLGCGPGCRCGPCRNLAEAYVEEDRTSGPHLGWIAWPGLERFGAPTAVATPRTTTPPALGAVAINMLLPGPGPGYDLYGDRNHQYGRADTIRALQDIGAAWQRSHPNGPIIGMGNISLLGGGFTPAHKAGHRLGLEVDIRPMRKDGRNLPVTYQDPAYSRELTQQLVNTIRANPLMPIRAIFFNDPAIAGVQPLEGHDNHLHVAFLPAAASGAPRPAPSIAPGAAIGSDRAIVRTAIARGERSANRLTDAIFFAHHPERQGRPITAGDTVSIAEWKSIRGGLVVPELTRAFGPPSTGRGPTGANGRPSSRR